ncbi:MAG TPA: DNA repair protein RecO [Acidobacteriota bacterium]|nr:DNA repair protein RecO [Acidobacteriota bacterium]
MNVHQSEALTLKTYPFAESNRIVIYLTRNFGKLRGVAHGARRPKSRFGSSLELLTHSRIVFYRKEHQELAVIQSAEIIKAYPSYEMSWEVNLHFNYFAELLLEFSREEEENERLFRLALAVLDACSAVPVSFLSRYFELWILKLEGVLPDLEKNLPGFGLKVRDIMRLPPRQLDASALSSEELRQLERLTGSLIEGHLEKRLKSRAVLNQLLL